MFASDDLQEQKWPRGNEHRFHWSHWTNGCGQRKTATLEQHVQLIYVALGNDIPRNLNDNHHILLGDCNCHPGVGPDYQPSLEVRAALACTSSSRSDAQQPDEDIQIWKADALLHTNNTAREMSVTELTEAPATELPVMGWDSSTSQPNLLGSGDTVFETQEITSFEMDAFDSDREVFLRHDLVTIKPNSAAYDAEGFMIDRRKCQASEKNITFLIHSRWGSRGGDL